jgi:hypothetical protein
VGALPLQATSVALIAVTAASVTKRFMSNPPAAAVQSERPMARPGDRGAGDGTEFIRLNVAVSRRSAHAARPAAAMDSVHRLTPNMCGYVCC